MKIKSIKYLKRSLLAIFFVMLAPLANAQPITGGDLGGGATLRDVVDRLDRILQFMTTAANDTVNSVKTYMYERLPGLPNTIAANSQVSPSNKLSNNLAEETSLTQIKQALISSDEELRGSYDPELAQNGITLLTLANAPASDIGITQNNVMPSAFGNNENNETEKELDAAFNFGTLMSALDLEEGSIKQQDAQKFIGYLAAQGQPFSTLPPLSSLSAKQRQELLISPEGRAYRLALRAMIANRSIAMDNLNHLLAERIVVTGLGKEAGMSKDNASPLEVKHYLATRRTDDPQWYAQMSTAAPPTVARESLFVLTEIQHQLYQLHLDNERIYAGLAALQLQNLEASKLALAQKSQLALSEMGLSNIAPNSTSLTENAGLSPDELQKIIRDKDLDNISDEDLDKLKNKLKK